MFALGTSIRGHYEAPSIWDEIAHVTVFAMRSIWKWRTVIHSANSRNAFGLNWFVNFPSLLRTSRCLKLDPLTSHSPSASAAYSSSLYGFEKL